MKWYTAVSRALWMEVPAKLLIAVNKFKIADPTRYLSKHAHDKGTALDALTGIISRAVNTISKFEDKVIRYQLKDRMKLDHELFVKVLGDSRKAAEKNRERGWERLEQATLFNLLY